MLREMLIMLVQDIQSIYGWRAHHQGILRPSTTSSSPVFVIPTCCRLYWQSTVLALYLLYLMSAGATVCLLYIFSLNVVSGTNFFAIFIPMILFGAVVVNAATASSLAVKKTGQGIADAVEGWCHRAFESDGDCFCDRRTNLWIVGGCDCVCSIFRR